MIPRFKFNNIKIKKMINNKKILKLNSRRG